MGFGSAGRCSAPSPACPAPRSSHSPRRHRPARRRAAPAAARRSATGGPAPHWRGTSSQYARARAFRSTALRAQHVAGAGGGTSVVSARLPGLPAAILAATGLGLRPRCAIGSVGRRITPRCSAISAKLHFQLASRRGRRAGEGLPAAHRHVDVDRIEFDRVADAAGHLGGDDGGARAAERLIDAWPGLLLFTIGRRMHSTGFCVPCSVCVSCPRLAICHSVVCFRSPCQ